METEQNKVVMRRVIDEVFNEMRFDVLPELFEPDFVEHQFGLRPTLDGLQQDVTWLHEKFPDLHLTIDHISSDGDLVWIHMTARGTNLGGLMGPPNGKSFEIAIFDLCRFANGKIVEHWGVPDRFAQMAQLGLLPQRQAA